MKTIEVHYSGPIYTKDEAQTDLNNPIYLLLFINLSLILFFISLLILFNFFDESHSMIKDYLCAQRIQYVTKIHIGLSARLFVSIFLEASSISYT